MLLVFLVRQQFHLYPQTNKTWLGSSHGRLSHQCVLATCPSPPTVFSLLRRLVTTHPIPASLFYPTLFHHFVEIHAYKENSLQLKTGVRSGILFFIIHATIEV